MGMVQWPIFLESHHLVAGFTERGPMGRSKDSHSVLKPAGTSLQEAAVIPSRPTWIQRRVRSCGVRSRTQMRPIGF